VPDGVEVLVRVRVGVRDGVQLGVGVLLGVAPTDSDAVDDGVVV